MDDEGVGPRVLVNRARLPDCRHLAANAQAALEILRERHAEFDLVFSDVVMPGASGIDLGQDMRRRWPDLPVVLTGGHSSVLAEEGSHGFPLIQKPYSVKYLVRMLGGSNDPSPRSRST